MMLLWLDGGGGGYMINAHTSIFHMATIVCIDYRCTHRTRGYVRMTSDEVWLLNLGGTPRSRVR